ncbi:MAG: Gfo/Idh/MocA family protein [Planctomycetota bacterium]|jgi:predicted dehydrogenase
MIRVGIVGFGFMGRMHYRCWKALKDVQVVAICDANPNLVEDTKKAVGNIEGASQTVDFGAVRIWRNFDKMLSEQPLDAVSITLPTCLHADFSIKALSAGLNVLCEKPMALNVGECERMIEAAGAGAKILQIGHCIRFWPEYAKAKEILAAGEYGKVVAATFQRLAAEPRWAWDNWIMDRQRSGGMALDLHIHDTDFVQYLFSVPPAVHSFGTKDADGHLVHIVTQYLYADNRAVTAEGSWAMTPAFGFEMSFNIMLEKATLVYDCTRQPSFRVCPAEGQAFTPEVEEGDGYFLEIAHFAERLRGKKADTVITLEQSRDSVRIVEAEKESIRTGEPVSVT